MATLQEELLRAARSNQSLGLPELQALAARGLHPDDMLTALLEAAPPLPSRSLHRLMGFVRALRMNLPQRP